MSIKNSPIAIWPTAGEKTTFHSGRGVASCVSGPLKFRKTPTPSHGEKGRRKKEMKSAGFKIKVLSAILTLLLSVSEAGPHPSFCQIWQADIRKSDTGARASRNYKGLWISEKCEIHPGPHFILRRYHILRSGHFNLIRYYYLDPWCTMASYSILAVGSFIPAPEKATSSSASWVVPGGIELEFTLRKVSVVPFSAESAKHLALKVNSSCPSITMPRWKPFKKYKVLSYEGHHIRKAKHRMESDSIDDVDCTQALDLHFNELQLMRLEHRTPPGFLAYRRSSAGETSRRYQSYLHLGADGYPSGSRPTYYQMPLIPSQTEHCSICHILSKATAASPPILTSAFNSDQPSSSLNGQWISQRCEVRPYGLFLRRILIFSAEDNRWQAQHSYYKDPLCQNPMFTLSAKGIYFPGSASKTVPDASEYDFQVSETFITPEDIQFANNMKGLVTCGSGRNWKVGHKVNLTSSGGCRELGIVVPSVELDLLRFERENPDLIFLYLGETMEGRERPASFQPALVRCSASDTAKTEDFFLNYNELHPLPLTSSASALLLCQNLVTILLNICILLNSRALF